jgi:CheY-like chemotaxis protein
MLQNEQGNPARLKFLVADDHAEFRRLVHDFLPEPKPVVIECNDGAEAVSRFAHELPDCVLMDVEMGALNNRFDRALRCPATLCRRCNGNLPRRSDRCPVADKSNIAPSLRLDQNRLRMTC